MIDFRSLSVSQKRLFLSTIVMALIVLVSFLSVALVSDEKKRIRPTEADVTVVGGTRMTGVEQFAAEMRAMRGQLESLSNDVEGLQEQNKTLREELEKKEEEREKEKTTINLDDLGMESDDDVLSTIDLTATDTETDEESLLLKPSPLGSDAALHADPPLSALPPPASSASNNAAMPPAGAPLDQAASLAPAPSAPPAPPAIRVFGEAGAMSEEQILAADAPPPGRQKPEDVFIPAGSMFTGVLLNGLDAPTSGAAQKNPTPVVMRIKREAVLPNYASIDVRECFLLAAGFGQLASERVILRSEALSCVRHDGDVIETNIDAYIVGTDGKVGIPGRLVSKQGAMIAQSLIAGVFSGIGQSLSTSSIPALNLATDSGVALQQREDLGSIMQNGIAGGLSTSANQIAEFYLDMAKETFPVVEISAGEVGTVIITSGSSLPLQGSSSLQLYSDKASQGRGSRTPSPSVTSSPRTSARAPAPAASAPPPNSTAAAATATAQRAMSALQPNLLNQPQPEW